MTYSLASSHDELGGDQLGPLEQPTTYNAKQRKAITLIGDMRKDNAVRRVLLEALGLL